jgi:predicted O-methyltransferase YrrM
LISVLAELPDVRRGAEVGVWCGPNAEALLSVFPNLHLLLVDTYVDEGQPNALISKYTAAEAREMASKAVQPYDGRYTWMIQPSVEAAALVPDGDLDFVFIDADHQYEPVKEDIEAWYPKVRNGGIVAGHDYSVHHKGVIRAVQERFGDRHKLARGKVWWVRKGVSSASLS